MPMNSKIHMAFDDKEPPRSKYESTMTYLEFLKKGHLDKTIKKDSAVPAKHLFEHTFQVKWHPDGGSVGKEMFAKKK